MKITNKQGLTLIEVVIYIGLFAMLLASAVLMLNYVFLIRIKVKTAMAVQDNTNFALSLITSLANEAEDVELPATGTNAYLKLRYSDAALDPTVVQVLNGQIVVSRGSGYPDWLTSDEVEVTDFSVSRLTVDPATVKIIIESIYRNAPSPYNATYTAAGSATIY